MRNLLEDIHAEPLAEFHHPLLMAGGAEVAALAGICKQIYMAAVFAFHTGKAVVRIAAVEIAMDHLLHVGPPETVLPGKMLIVDPDEGLKIVFHAAIIIGCLRISGPINGGWSGHDSSSPRKTGRLY
jgi:hypothetical protein